MHKNTKVSLTVVAGAVAAMAAVGFAVWWFFLRKRVVEVNASVTVPEDEIAVRYTPTPRDGG